MSLKKETLRSLGNFIHHEAYELRKIEEPLEILTTFKPMDSTSQNIIRAVSHHDIASLHRFLSDLSTTRKRELLNTANINGRPLLNYAVVSGHLELLHCLLDHGADPSQTTSTGRTALHEAIRAGLPEVAKILLKPSSRDETDGLSKGHEKISTGRHSFSTSGLAIESLATLVNTGNLVNMKDDVGLTPILMLSEVTTISSEMFTSLVKELVINGASADVIHPGTGQTILFRAVELHTLDACAQLVESGVSIDVQDFAGDTVVHLAAKLDQSSILKFFLQRSKLSVNCHNKRGETPLHKAAFAGSRNCLSILLDFGADLSARDGDYQTGLDAIFSYLPRPSSFLLNLFNSKILSNGCALNDRRFQLTLDFRVLSPDRTRQMSVVVALMNALHHLDKKNLLAHPLIEVYLRAKWRRMRVFFILLVLIHMFFVLSLSAHVVLHLYPESPLNVTWSRRILMIFAFILTCHVSVQTALAPRYFLHETETWLSLTCIGLAFALGIGGELKAGGEWTRHVASFAVLFAWGQVMFILGRLPAVGFFALMFFKVLKNVIKVLMISVCLVIGFALSFCVQFNNFEYDSVGRTLIRTTVMLMGEYNYETLFRNDDERLKNRIGFEGLLKNRIGDFWENKPPFLPITSYIIFILFILLGSVVLVNLMIGLAVSDIQGLKEEGNLRHMIKQAEFLLHTDLILSRFNFFQKRQATPAMVTISPNSTNKTRRIHYRMLGLSIPLSVMEGLITIALNNERNNREVKEEEDTNYRCRNCEIQISV